MTIKIWDLSEMLVINTILGKHTRNVTKALMYNETTLVSCSDDGMLMFWDIKGDMKEPVHTLSTNESKNSKYVSFMTFMKDGTLLSAH
jgi:WD40 repeat protein